MKKLTLRELDVIADRMTVKVEAQQKKEWQEERDAVDAVNQDLAKDIRKDALAVPSRIKKLLAGSVREYNARVTIDKIIMSLRPKKFINSWNSGEASFTFDSYSTQLRIKDDLIIQQIDSPDATALQRIVAKRFGITV